jgi:hypothetical protein
MAHTPRKPRCPPIPEPASNSLDAQIVAMLRGRTPEQLEVARAIVIALLYPRHPTGGPSAN